MNKSFVKKIIKAKVLEYEAIKELIPKSIQNKMEFIENELVDTFKDIALEILMEEKTNNKETDLSDKRKAKKVSVEFN